MNKDAIKNGILFGGYINDIAAKSLYIKPSVSLPGVPACEVHDAVKALLSQELVYPRESGDIDDSQFGINIAGIPPLTITSKGKDRLNELLNNQAQLGILDNWNITLNIGSGHVERHETHVTFSVSSFEEAVSQKIESSPGSPEEKAEAKSRLRAFVEHPLVNTILGAALGAILK